MRTFLFLIFSFLVSFKSLAQEISYAYDEAGNRVKREVVIGKKRGAAASKKKAPSYSDMLSNHEILIAPNPTKGKVKVSVPNIDANFDVHVYSSGGQVIVSQPSVRDYTEIDLTNQPDGVYVLVISFGQEKTTWKIIKTD